MDGQDLQDIYISFFILFILYIHVNKVFQIVIDRNKQWVFLFYPDHPSIHVNKKIVC